MNRLSAIIRHEYWKRVRSLGFILTTVLGPVVLAATFIIPVLIAFIQPTAPKVAVVDQSGELYQPLRAAIEEHDPRVATTLGWHWRTPLADGAESALAAIS